MFITLITSTFELEQMFVPIYIVLHNIHRLVLNCRETKVLSLEDKNVCDQLKLYSHNNGYFVVTWTNQKQKAIKLEYVQWGSS